VTHDGSFPGRPPGRRARHDHDTPGWPGYDAAQQAQPEQREFPDLAPIRPREARPGDGRGPGNWPGQPWGQHAPAGAPPAWGQRGPGPSPRSPEPEPEENIPDWAEPDSMQAFSSRWHRRGLDSRGERRSDRRKRRRVLIAAGSAAAVIVAVAAYLIVGTGGGGSGSLGFGSLVTTFLPGELQTVPNACGTVPASTLSQYLPGTLKQVSPPLNTGANTECTWTLDHPPTWRVLEVQLVAYSPSALYGNGSATVVAATIFQSSEGSLAKPGPKSGQPAATVTSLSGMPGGSGTSAFQATQVFRRSGATTDVADVLVRYRNVVITVVVDGLDQANGPRKYGPVAMSDLTATARSVAREVAAKIVG
jgi:hypothetical protein